MHDDNEKQEPRTKRAIKGLPRRVLPVLGLVWIACSAALLCLGLVGLLPGVAASGEGGALALVLESVVSVAWLSPLLIVTSLTGGVALLGGTHPVTTLLGGASVMAALAYAGSSERGELFASTIAGSLTPVVVVHWLVPRWTPRRTTDTLLTLLGLFVLTGGLGFIVLAAVGALLAEPGQGIPAIGNLVGLWSTFLGLLGLALTGTAAVVDSASRVIERVCRKTTHS
jgi:hypothetical protein